jgi:hypothetical protein
MTMSLAPIATDLPCVSCGYNLRGLDPSGRCPECATPIADSMRGDLLRFSNPEWLRKVRWGSRILYWEGIVLVAGTVLTMMVFPMPYPSYVPLLCASAVAYWAVYAVATLLLTATEPRLSLIATRGALWYLARGASMMGLMAALLCVVGDQFASEYIGLVGIVLLCISFGVAFWAQFAYVRELSLRIPSVSVASYAAVLKWGLGLSFSLFGILALVATIAPPTAPPKPRWYIALDVLAITVQTTMVFGYLSGCALMGEFHKAVRMLDAAQHFETEQHDRD